MIGGVWHVIGDVALVIFCVVFAVFMVVMFAMGESRA